MALLGLDIEPAGLLSFDVMLGPLAGIEAHAVEIGDRDAPALRLQRAPRDLSQIGVVRLGLGMGQNDMSLHRCSSPLRRSALEVYHGK